MHLTPIDKKIISVLKKADMPLSTYEIAKRVGITWPTANSHCYKLKSLGLIKNKEEEFKQTGKIMWWI